MVLFIIIYLVYSLHFLIIVNIDCMTYYDVIINLIVKNMRVKKSSKIYLHSRFAQ